MTSKMLKVSQPVFCLNLLADSDSLGLGDGLCLGPVEDLISTVPEVLFIA